MLPVLTSCAGDVLPKRRCLDRGPVAQIVWKMILDHVPIDVLTSLRPRCWPWLIPVRMSVAPIPVVPLHVMVLPVVFPIIPVF